MFTEGFEGLDEAEDSPRRVYVSNMSQDEMDKLIRENDKLKKALEKEKFFNKLLDQEIQELKNNHGQPEQHYSPYWYGAKGVSKGAFYTLLFITLAMGAYIGYGIYYDKQFDYIQDLNPVSNTTPAQEPGNNSFSTPATPANEPAAVNDRAVPTDAPVSTNDNDPAPASVVQEPVEPAKPAVKDSVPPIIANNRQQAERERTTPPPAPAPKEVDVESAVTNAPGDVDTRPVIARYQVSSKANFYSNPDENSLRNTFISPGNDKIVGALEEKNGFIFVVYTNDLGYTSRGWLSVKDLTKL